MQWRASDGTNADLIGSFATFISYRNKRANFETNILPKIKRDLKKHLFYYRIKNKNGEVWGRKMSLSLSRVFRNTRWWPQKSQKRPKFTQHIYIAFSKKN